MDIEPGSEPKMNPISKLLVSLLILLSFGCIVLLVLLIISSALTLAGLFLIGLAIVLPLLIAGNMIRMAFRNHKRNHHY